MYTFVRTTIQTMAHALGDFLRWIISKELLFQRTYFDCIPGKFVALVSNDDEQRQQALEFCRRPFEALEEFDALADTDKHAREMHGTLLWPLATWSHEVLLALYECDFDGVLGSADAGMYKELTECFRGWVSSWSIERSSQSVQREPCSPIEQPVYVAQSSQLLCCRELSESTLGCAA